MINFKGNMGVAPYMTTTLARNDEATVKTPNSAHQQKVPNGVLSSYYDYPTASQSALQEGMFRYRNLVNSRPVMLSNTSVDFSEWLKQFDNVEDRNLVLKMLQNYAYIDIENARKAFRKLHTELESEVDINKTKFATLGAVKSGSMMGYLYCQANKMRSKGAVHHQYTDTTGLSNCEKFLTFTELQNPEFNKKEAQNGTETIVIVDDIIGDGDSLMEYFTPELVESLKNYKNIYYMTLVKDPDGEKNVKEKFPELNIKFKSAEVLHKYDSPENKSFTDEEKVKIKKLLDKYGNRIAPELVDKYSRSKLFVSFAWNTPGNTPMIFNYTNQNGKERQQNWQALFERFNGLQKGVVGDNCNFYC